MLSEDQVYEDLKNLSEGLGYFLVDLRVKKTRYGLSGQIVLHKPGGVDTGDCSIFYKACLPRLEVLFDTQDVSLEVSSPGTDRVIRLPREYPYFLERGFSLYLKNGQNAEGILKEITATSIKLLKNNELKEYALSDIQKAKLDDTQEVT